MTDEAPATESTTSSFAAMGALSTSAPSTSGDDIGAFLDKQMAVSAAAANRQISDADSDDSSAPDGTWSLLGAAGDDPAAHLDQVMEEARVAADAQAALEVE